MKEYATYQDFANYLQTLATLFSEYGNETMEADSEFERLHTRLCMIHNDWDHGARRIEDLKAIFIKQTEEYGQGFEENVFFVK